MTAMASDIFWAAWLDKIGRRPLILCQPLACACNMAIIVGLYATYAGTTNLAGLRALCAMVYLFVFVYSMDEPAEYVFIAEIFPTHVRTKGIALGTASIMLTSVWLTMSAPIGMATIGWKYFLILCLLGVVYFFAQWKFIKESKFPPYNPCSGRPRRIWRRSETCVDCTLNTWAAKGVPLEEIDAIFGDGENVAVYSKDIVLDNKGIHSTGEPWRTNAAEELMRERAQ
jgi:MFS family permease